MRRLCLKGKVIACNILTTQFIAPEEGQDGPKKTTVTILFEDPEDVEATGDVAAGFKVDTDVSLTLEAPNED